MKGTWIVESQSKSIKARFEGVTAGLVDWLARKGVTAMQVSMAGLVGTLVGAVMIAAGDFWFGPWVFALSSTIDALDGALARRTGTVSEWGAFVDSTLDRVGEGAGFAAIAVWFALQGEAVGVALAVTAQLGGNLTSYIRALAEARGIECTEGWVGRPGRVFIFSLLLFLQQPMLMIILLTIASCATAAQRAFIVYRGLAELSRGPAGTRS
ncbi:MAG: CDP-alcohol phosphatidyltransferase family protein [Gammaproteobacteria bacterium]|nr:CDP-alcohol phosphatidyltransferase family protein [Gammaproteobacteria bacterium]